MRTIKIYPERTEYSAGETVSGTVEMENDKDFTFNSAHITLEGREHTSVTKQVGKHTYTYTEEYFHMNDRIDLIEPGLMQTGNMRVPFSFKIPESVPSSYDGERGELEYTLKAKIEVSWARDPKDEVLLKVIETPKQIDPRSIVTSEIDDGISILDVELENNEVCLGQPLKLRYRVDRDVNMRGVRIDLLSTEHAVAEGNKSALHQMLYSNLVENNQIIRGSWMDHVIETIPEWPVSYEGPLLTIAPTLKVVIDIPMRFDKQVEIPIVIRYCPKSQVAQSEADSFGFDFE